MRAWPASLVLALAGLAGCLADDPSIEGNTEDAGHAAADLPGPAVEATSIDATFDLLTDSVDETWTWSMSPNMSGHVKIVYTADPVGDGGHTICYDLSWPQGRHSGGSNCSGGIPAGISVQFDGDTILGTETVYEADLYPNDFTLQIWAPNGPDAAKLHVVVNTNAR